MVLENIEGVPEASPQDIRDSFDYAAKHYLGISGDEFLRRLDADLIEPEDAKTKKVLRRVELVRPGFGRAA